MLIMGAFFAVAALAFLVGLWLAYTEQQEMLAKEAAQAEPKTAVTAMVAKMPVVVMEQEGEAPINETHLAAARKLRTRVSSGQLRELALELRSLQMQAGEINERLLLLSTMVEAHIEEMVVSPIEFREGLAV